MSSTRTSTRPTTHPSLRSAALPLFALCLAFFVEMVDNTLLTIALPTIGRDLGSGTTALQWVTGAYSLTFGGMLLTAGSAADRLGRRRVLLTGLAAFGLVSLAVVAVRGAGELIALRAALGVAAAMMAPVTMSLIFRLFDDEKLRMRAITVVMVVGMSGMVLGPVLGGTALVHVSWEWLLLANAPIALVAWIGVRLGVPADRDEDLTTDPLDLLGSLLTIATIGFGCYTLTVGVEHGWTSAATIASLLAAVAAGVAFVRHENATAFPMLDLTLFRNGPARGAAITQMGAAITMASVMFGLVLHFQYAYGWSPVRAGLANLPLIVTMIAATPLCEWLAARFGHRIACLIGTGLLVTSLVGMAWSVEHGYVAIAISMAVLTLGLRTIMVICAVALVEAMPRNRTSIGAALNDTAQEVGSSIGIAVVGTMIAALVTRSLPAGLWGDELVASFFHGERITYIVLAAIVGVVATYGSMNLSDSHATDEHALEEAVEAVAV
jgi:EmrB/QacA subfamily drug resistance transporter